MNAIDTHGLQTVLLLLASAVFVVSVCRSFGLPPLIGYLAVGVAIGPHALRWVDDSSNAADLAEFGVVFLMFSIGLEFNLNKLFQMRRLVFGLGLMQLVLSMVIATLLLAAHGESWRAGVTLAAMLAMSSTAIASRMLAERRELESPHGRIALGVLLFQDLAVVPLLIVLPALSGNPETLAGELAVAGLKAAVILAIVLFAGQRMMRRLFHMVARRQSNELFIITVLLVLLGLAFATAVAGLSLALGAFLAGMLIGETEYRYQVEEDIKPFREVLLGLFFVTMGMRLDVAQVAASLPLVSILFVGQLLLKLCIVAGIARVTGASAPTALRSGLALAQAGEFGLVIGALAASLDLVPAGLLQAVVASMILSMFVGPLLIHFSDALVLRLARSEWMTQSLALTRLASAAMEADRHVVICGFGRTGQALVRFLDEEHIPYVALDLDPLRISEADAAGERVLYGDAARRQTLITAGIHRAAALVISYVDLDSSLAILEHVRALAPTLPVIVRTLDDSNLEKLVRAGATEVVPETLEAGITLASHTLVLMGVPINRVTARVTAARDQRYSLLRGFFHGATDLSGPDEASQPRLHSVVLEHGAFAIGKTVSDLDLGRRGVRLWSVRRPAGRVDTPPDDFRLEEGDAAVVIGDANAVASAERRLLRGAA